MYVYFYSLHVSGNCVPIIRRINCINMTSGICHCVYMTVWYVHRVTYTIYDFDTITVIPRLTSDPANEFFG